MSKQLESNNSPVKYNYELDLKQLDQVKIKVEEETVRLPKYIGNENIEAIDYCHQRFIREANDNNWTVRQQFKFFGKIIDGSALTYWNDQVIPQYAALLTGNRSPRQAQFDDAIEQMLSNFGGGNKARDNILKELQGINSRKPKNRTVLEHINRIKAIINIANHVQGLEPKITDACMKKIIFNSFPKSWQQNWLHAGKDIHTSTINEIQQYFETQKDITDTGNIFNNKKGNSQGFKNNNQKQFNNNNKRKFQDSNNTNNIPANLLCHSKKHKPNAIIKHKWADCSFNPQSKNYNEKRDQQARARFNNNVNSYQTNKNQGAPPFSKPYNPQNKSRIQETHAIMHTSNNQMSSLPSTIYTQDNQELNHNNAIEMHPFDIIGVPQAAAQSSNKSINPYGFQGAFSQKIV